MTDEINIEPYLIPTITDRGFKHMPVISGTYDDHDVRVYESSAADGPHIWLRAWDGERVVTVHLPVADSLQLAEQIQWLAANHYQLRANGNAPVESAPVERPDHVSLPKAGKVVGKVRIHREAPAQVGRDGAPVDAALDGDRPASSCCDSHNVHCEPPSELCCGFCTEVCHPEHAQGVVCVLEAARAAADTTTGVDHG